jgi:hypothetical protein
MVSFEADVWHAGQFLGGLPDLELGVVWKDETGADFLTCRALSGTLIEDKLEVNTPQ